MSSRYSHKTRPIEDRINHLEYGEFARMGHTYMQSHNDTIVHWHANDWAIFGPSPSHGIVYVIRLKHWNNV